MAETTSYGAVSADLMNPLHRQTSAGIGLPQNVLYPVLVF